MKAGSAGSNPDGITTASPPFKVFLQDVGQTVSNLNTIVVGLDAVEAGHAKPDSLNISWAPDDRQAASRKARKFALEATLVHTSAAIVEFVTAMGRLPRFQECLDWTGQTKNADKVGGLLKEALGDNYLVPATTLVIHWRNRIIHPSSNAKLDADAKRLLQINEEEISAKYKSLSTDQLLAHFETGRPTLKDVSSLISMAINAARAVEGNTCPKVTIGDLDVWLEYYGVTSIIARIRRETVTSKVEASVRRAIRTHAPGLLAAYEQYYGAA